MLLHSAITKIETLNRITTIELKIHDAYSQKNI